MTPTFRRGTFNDLCAVFDVFTQTTIDLERRMGLAESQIIWSDPAFVEYYWERYKPLFAHLTRTAEHFWIVEEDGQIIGYARTTLHDGVRELIEYFVLPAYQAKGVGRGLLERAFPAQGARQRVIIATTEIHALARYLKAGVYPRFPIYYISKKPEPVSIETDLVIKSGRASPETLAALREIDRAILGFERDADHRFLLGDRQVQLYYRGDQLSGYGYTGKALGPIALLDEADFPAVLARAETEAARRGEDEFGMQLPLVNRIAVDYLLGRGYRFEDFTVLLMSDHPFGRFENYILTSPPFFI